MADFDANMVTNVDGLRALYAQPVDRIVSKQLDHVNAAGRAFIVDALCDVAGSVVVSMRPGKSAEDRHALEIK